MICENIIVGLTRLSVQASCIMNTECYKLEVEDKKNTIKSGMRVNTDLEKTFFIMYYLRK